MPTLQPHIRRSIGEGGLAIVDQGVVSFTSFATTVILGRIAGPSELALYSLGLTLLLFLTAAQDSLMSAPYTIYGARLNDADRAAYTGCTLFFCATLALAASLTLASAGAIVTTIIGPPELGRVLLAVAVVASGVVLRELGRRVSVANFRIGTALALDTSVGAVQGVGLIWLVSQGALTATSALLVTGAAHAAGGMIWLVAWRMRARICLNPGMLRPAWREHWAMGRWLGASRIVGHLSSDVLLLWLLTLGLGASSAGAFAACLTIAFVTNPVVLGVGLFLTPRLAATFADRGGRAVAREAVGATVALALPLAGFVALVAAGGERLLFAIYGPEFSGLGGTATVVALAVVLGALAIGATNALVVLERPGLNLLAGLPGLATMLVSTLVLVPSYGVLGAALGFCAGNVVQLLARFVLLARVVAAASDARPAPLEVGAARA